VSQHRYQHTFAMIPEADWHTYAASCAGAFVLIVDAITTDADGTCTLILTHFY